MTFLSDTEKKYQNLISQTDIMETKAEIIILMQHYSEKHHDDIALLFAMPSVLNYDFQKM